MNLNNLVIDTANYKSTVNKSIGCMLQVQYRNLDFNLSSEARYNLDDTENGP